MNILINKQCELLKIDINKLSIYWYFFCNNDNYNIIFNDVINIIINNIYIKIYINWCNEVN